MNKVGRCINARGLVSGPMKVGSDAPFRRFTKKLKIKPKTRVRIEGATDVVKIAATRNPVVRTIDDADAVRRAIQEMKTGRRPKTLLEKLQSL